MTSHVELFNAAVRSGDWASFAALLHPDAVMTFSPGPSFAGREAILAAYQASPPSDTMRAIRSRFVAGEGAGSPGPEPAAPGAAPPPSPGAAPPPSPGAAPPPSPGAAPRPSPGAASAPATTAPSSDISEITDFEWSRGGTGTMTIRRSGGLITSLAVEFT